METESPPPSDPAPAASAPRRKSKSLPGWLVVLVLVVVVGVFAGGIYYATLPRNGMTVEAIDAEVRQKIVIGSSTPDDARAWSVARGFSDVSDSFDAGGRKNGILAQTPNDTWLTKQQLAVQFSYDKSGRITKISVYQMQRPETP